VFYTALNFVDGAMMDLSINGLRTRRNSGSRGEVEEVEGRGKEGNSAISVSAHFLAGEIGEGCGGGEG